MAEEDDGAIVGGGFSIAPRSDAGGLIKAAESEKAFLPRIIHFVAASGGTPGPAAGGDPDRDGPVPPRYLYPRDRLEALWTAGKLRQVGRGLNNAGNTCFFNSVLQTLTYTRPLQRYLLTGEHTRACAAPKEGTFCALCIFERHVQEVLTAGRSSVHPKQLLRRLKQLGGKSMQLGRQEDAHEFLLQFLDSCHKAALQPALQSGSVPPLVQRTTLIHQLFGGYLRSQVVCLECQHESNTFDPFLDLSLEVRTARTLEEALNGFTKSERLSGPNRYKCKQCQRPVDVTKRFFVHALPPLMMFQLKRFEFSQGTRGKIIKNVAFGTSVDLGKFTSHPEQQAKYLLYAVIVHQGHSAKSGHYFAYARHADGKWYQFDDEKVSMVREQEVLRQQAYLLFYEAAKPSREPVAAVGAVPAPAAAPTPADPSTAACSGATTPAEPNVSSGAPTATAPPVNGAASTPVEPKKDATDQAVRKEEATVDTVMASASPETEQAERKEDSFVNDVLTSFSAVLEADGRKEDATVDNAITSASAAVAPQEDATVGTAITSASAAVAQQEGEPGGEEAPVEDVAMPDGPVTVPRSRSLPRLGRCNRRLLMLKRLRKAVEPVRVLQLVPAPPAPLPAKPARIADLMEASRVPDHSSQFGRADVDNWDGAARSRAFEAAQQLLQPAPERRDELDMNYDVGKKKHKPRQAKPTFAGKAIFDEEMKRRLQVQASKRASGRFGDGQVEQVERNRKMKRARRA